jgi:hypothetical protein
VAGSANKKIEVVRFDRAPLTGFVQVPEGLSGDHVELLTPEGNLLRVPFSETKAVCFVRDFDESPVWKPNRAFATRPKSPGLWVRIRFRDGDWLEGILPNNLLLMESAGFSAIPPDPASQLQRVFVPREAASGVEVLGVVGSSVRRRPQKPADKEKQITMFE